MLLKTNIWCKLLLKDVEHVPNMHLNLISIEKLDDEGYHNQFGGEKWKLRKGSLILVKGRKINTLYKTNARLINGDVVMLRMKFPLRYGIRGLVTLVTWDFKFLKRSSLYLISKVHN